LAKNGADTFVLEFQTINWKKPTKTKMRIAVPEAVAFNYLQDWPQI
jgi:hypothetical protein